MKPRWWLIWFLLAVQVALVIGGWVCLLAGLLHVRGWWLAAALAWFAVIAVVGAFARFSGGAAVGRDRREWKGLALGVACFAPAGAALVFSPLPWRLIGLIGIAALFLETPVYVFARRQLQQFRASGG
jgi:hypothetical protein